VEKRLAATWQEARELRRLATQAGVILETGLILRHESSHRWLHQQIAEGAFGDLVSFMARRNSSLSSFAAIADRIHTVHRTLIHDIDLLLWLSRSRVTSVMAMEVSQGDHLAPQGCFALLQLANGGVAQLHPDLTLWPETGGRARGALRDQLAAALSTSSSARRLPSRSRTKPIIRLTPWRLPLLPPIRPPGFARSSPGSTPAPRRDARESPPGRRR